MKYFHSKFGKIAPDLCHLQDCRISTSVCGRMCENLIKETVALRNRIKAYNTHRVMMLLLHICVYNVISTSSLVQPWIHWSSSNPMSQESISIRHRFDTKYRIGVLQNVRISINKRKKNGPVIVKLPWRIWNHLNETIRPNLVQGDFQRKHVIRIRTIHSYLANWTAFMLGILSHDCYCIKRYRIFMIQLRDRFVLANLTDDSQNDWPYF